MQNLIQELTKSNSQVVGLAPMDGVSDSPYRFIAKKYGNPDILFTEFTHVHGLCVAGHKLLHHFVYDHSQRPIVAQIYGAEPEYFYHAAKLVCALGFDGLDINMGCPAKNVASSGAGAGLIRTPELAKEIVYETKRGIADWVKDGKLTGLLKKPREAVENMIEARREELQEPKSIGEGNLLGTRTAIPVSIKTRIGYDVPVTETWIQNLAETKPEWITVHGRTLKQMYSGRASVEEQKIAVQSTDIPIWVNGDIESRRGALELIKETGAKGALIGRAAFGNPWVFNDSVPSESEVLEAMVEHATLFDKLNRNEDGTSNEKAFIQMRKHFGWYLKTISKLKAQSTKGVDPEEMVKLRNLKIKLMQVKSLEEVENILSNAL